MHEILILLRAMGLFAHDAHHHVAHVPFFADHEFFGDTYTELITDYDDIAERAIGLMGDEAVNLQLILPGVMQILQGAPGVKISQNSAFFNFQLKLELELCAKLDHFIKSGQLTSGTEQLLGEICNKSESRQYKIKQRIK